MRIPSTQPIFDRETVFQLVGQKKWLDIIELFKDNRRGEAVLSDPILKNFIDWKEDKTVIAIIHNDNYYCCGNGLF